MNPRAMFAAFATFCGVSISSAAEAGQYTCQVPVAVICQGCSKHVVISLQPGGGCRVSFNPLPEESQRHAAGAVDLQIQTPPARLAPRGRTAYRNRLVLGSRQPSNHACFVFNGQQYCE
jgi:hypothetical protein